MAHQGRHPLCILEVEKSMRVWSARPGAPTMMKRSYLKGTIRTTKGVLKRFEIDLDDVSKLLAGLMTLRLAIEFEWSYYSFCCGL